MTRAIVRYAGHIATIRLAFDEIPEEAGTKYDYDSAFKFCDDLACNVKQERDLFILEALGTAKVIVEQCWEQISLEADFLKCERGLTGAQIMQILTEYLEAIPRVIF